jgi:hypothetical protein
VQSTVYAPLAQTEQLWQPLLLTRTVQIFLLIGSSSTRTMCNGLRPLSMVGSARMASTSVDSGKMEYSTKRCVVVASLPPSWGMGGIFAAMAGGKMVPSHVEHRAVPEQSSQVPPFHNCCAWVAARPMTTTRSKNAGRRNVQEATIPDFSASNQHCCKNVSFQNGPNGVGKRPARWVIGHAGPRSNSNSSTSREHSERVHWEFYGLLHNHKLVAPRPPTPSPSFERP